MGIFDIFTQGTETGAERSPERLDVSRATEGVEGVELPSNNVELRTDIPGIERAIVAGRPFETAERMDSVQGDNALGYTQDCGLTSVANVAQLCGVNATEDGVVERAVRIGECQNSWFIPASERGGANDLNIINLLGSYGIEAHAESAQSPEGSLEAIAHYCENGQRVTMGLNAGMAWNEPQYVGDGSANHQVTVLGSVRDADTGSVAGVYICDSGSNEPCRFVDAAALEEMYTNVPGATVVVTDRAYA